MIKKNTIGVDFGTDSVRVQFVNAFEGNILATGSARFKRWGDGLYCRPGQSQFRQHPLDHIESFELAMQEAVQQLNQDDLSAVKGISVASTGSTPIAVDREGTPLSMKKSFANNPNAMFFLWKDHSAIGEAAEINQKCREGHPVDYTKYMGSEYSSEWFWAKLIYVLRNDVGVKEQLFSWVEHCDWFTALLTGQTNPLDLKRSRCAAGHKAMWHEEWDGLPPVDFFKRLDPSLEDIRQRMGKATFTSDAVAGTLSPEWAQKFGLPADTIVGVGSLDAHIGAIGGEIQDGWLVKVMGTSTCDMLVAPKETVNGTVEGICGQVNGSVLPNRIGFEAGQAAFGDIYAWFGEVISWPLRHILEKDGNIDGSIKQTIIDKVTGELLPELGISAEKLPLSETGPIALDWMNGRRTPFSNQLLKGGFTGLTLGTTAPAMFRALVEATAFGSKKIIAHFKEQNVQIEGIIAIGGVAHKSNFVMQVLADVLDQPIKVAKAEQPVALGAAMAAAVACKLHNTFEEAQKTMGSGFMKEFHPIPENVQKYHQLYLRYTDFGTFVESLNY
ncbi:MAG: ribulokinase [Flavobacteriia bacterium]|nr:MAG: ribulokinase [Flavobacteriia bacterium]